MGKTIGEPDPKSNLKEFLYELGRNCFRSGVPEEDTIHWTWFGWIFKILKQKYDKRSGISTGRWMDSEINPASLRHNDGSKDQ